ncbi:MAG: hypothetical protein AUK03_15585 [Anaerolineae bacterium CG2_30_64_16]|nr:MAG: hypothetical protein AUK03_15585 [Anaerolineae bacterium CG2_30_64_16]
MFTRFPSKGILWLVATALLVTVLFIVSCQAPTPEVVEKVVTQEVPVEVTRVVEKQVPVEVTRVVEKEVTREVPVEVTRVVEVPVPAAAVPAAVSSIITAKCVGCHVALPSTHMGEQDSDQCGLCHVPYGQTAVVAHTATTEGCTMCHNSPAVTHFYLRDQKEQTVLAADIDAKCYACHRDSPGGAQAEGRGTPPLETEADILAAAQQGTLRSWIQPGGFMAKYVTADEVATITDWVDTISTDRTLAYDPYLDAVKIDSDFEIGDLGNEAWDAAPEHGVSVRPTIYTAADEIKMKALYSDEYLYVRVEYADDTASMTRSGSWILDNGAWRHPVAATENDKQSEDRVSILWNISTPDFRDHNGCAIKCHGNVPGSSEFTDLEGATMDIWHTKAARALGLYSATDNGDLTVDTATEAFEVTAGTLDFLGVVDDKWLVWYMDLDDGYDLEDAGRRGDAGKSMYANNRNGDKSGPLYMESEPESWADAMFLTQAEVDAGETLIADPTDAAYDAAAVAAAWDNYVALGAVAPERVLREPEGSRGDVLHAASWQDGVWVNVFRRALVTGNPDDTQFDLASAPEYDFSITVFDNCGRGEIPPGHTTYGDGQYQVLRFQQ